MKTDFLISKVAIRERKKITMLGKVKWFDEKRGFGFIQGEDGRDIFVHWKSITPKYEQNGKRLFATLSENARVRFEIESKDGRIITITVTEIEEKQSERSDKNTGEKEVIGEERPM